MSEVVPEGRVQNLTKEQESRLKQVWAYLFKFWDIPVDASLVLSKAKDQEAILANGGSKNTGSGRMKLLGLFSSKRKDGSDSTRSSRRRSSASVTTRSRESIEAAYKHSMIHESLKDLDPTELSEDFWKMLRCDYPDNLLLRFVRARKWDTDKAMGMIAHSLRWRIKEGHPDEIIRGGESAMYEADKKGVIKQLELAKATVRGFDKQGSPIVYVRPRLHHSSDQSELDVQEYSLLIIEQARLFVKEPKESATVLFDLSGFSMANMDYGPVKFLISCFEAHYPECLGKLFIHKAPWIFPPIWNIIKNWLDPVVASKIIFTKSLKDLEEYIPAEHIPKSLGGLDDYDFDGFVRPDPSADEMLKDDETKEALLEERKAIIEKFIKSTVAWIESTTDEASAKWLKTKIELSEELCENYCKLDPYIRSRSFYDLNGTLKV